MTNTGYEMQLAEKDARVDQLRAELAAALAACKAKDEALKAELQAFGVVLVQLAHAMSQEALAIQPDDAALRTWLGEPVGEVKKHTGSLKDMAIIVWTGQQPEEGTKLYHPKGLK